MLNDFQVQKTFLDGALEGLTITDDLKRLDSRLGQPFKVGQVVKSCLGSSFRIEAIQMTGPSR